MITFQEVEKMIEQAHKYKDRAEADGNSNYYYWDGYINALEAIVFQLPNNDNPKPTNKVLKKIRAKQ